MGELSPVVTNEDEGSPDLASSLIQKLVDEFATQLDESLILAIASDRDIVEHFEDIRNDLLPLAESATAEEATGFDPSGLGHLTDFDALALDDEALTSPNGTLQSKSTDVATTVSETSADLDSPAVFTSQTELSDTDKVQNLQMIFNFEEHTIRFILKQCDGDLERAFDELLNRQFLDESGELPKGIEGFANSNGAASAGQNRRRRQGAQQKAARTPLLVDYSVSSPAVELEEEPESKGKAGRSSQGRGTGQTLPVSHPSLSLAGPRNRVVVGSTAAVPSASALPQAPAKPNAWNVVTKKKATKKEGRPGEPVSALETANYSAQQAGSLARRGASDPLLRQGVAVYAGRARDEFQIVKVLNSLEAERLVDSTSTPWKIDLHGVSVLDGVRIAKGRVWGWWDQLGEDQSKRARIEGFTVVTGLGRHSTNGISRLRQAVFAALKNDGWRVSALTGEFYITGRA